MPTEIWTASDLDTLVRADRSGNYIQKADISLADFPNWEPIGVDWNTMFTGTYNGGGFTISNLTQNIGGTAYAEEWGNGGLFGICNTATIQNVHLKDVNVTNPTGGIGALCGYVWEGEVTDCSVVGGSVDGSDTVGGLIGECYDNATIVRCFSSVTVSSSGVDCGGFIATVIGNTALHNVSISQCYSIGNVESTVNTVGGFASTVRSYDGNVHVTDCYAVGNVTGAEKVGGFVGYAHQGVGNCIIEYCHSVGIVTGTLDTGGFCGENNDLNLATIYYCFYDETTSGQIDTGKGTPRSTQQMKDVDTFIGWDGWHILTHPTNLNNGYPYLAWQLNEETTVNWKIYKEAVSPPIIHPTSITMEENTVTSIHASGEVTWSTSNDQVAAIEVDIDFVIVYAVSEGTAVITATNDGGTASCSITVQEKAVQTFDGIKICDSNFSELATLNNQDIVQLPITKELSGNYSLEVTLPMNAYGVNYLRQGRYLQCENQYFTIDKLSPSRSFDDIPMITVSAVHIFFESAHWVHHPHKEIGFRGNILTHLNEIFSDSDYTAIGTQANHPFYNVERFIEYKKHSKILDAVKLIFNTFGGHFKLDGFSLIILPYETMGSSGTSFEYTINNQSIRRELVDTDVVTRLFATGGTNINGEPLKRLVEAEQSIQNLYRRDKVEFINMSDVRVWNNFVLLTDQYLNRKKYPRVSYELNIAELRHLYAGQYTFDLGQTVRVIDHDLGIDVEKPLTKYIYRPLEPDFISTIVVGDKIPDYTFREQRFEGQVGETEGEWRYDELAERWIFFPNDLWEDDADGEDQWGKEYVLWIDKVGGDGSLKYQYLPSKDAPESVKFSVQTIPSNSGDITLNIDGNNYYIYVQAGESRASIAEKIYNLNILGWTNEKDGWDVIFSAGYKVIGEELTTIDHLTYTFAHGPIREQTVTISGNTSSYTIDYEAGTVTFDHSQEGNTILADYEYDVVGSRSHLASVTTGDTGAEITVIISEGTFAGQWTPWIEGRYTFRRRFSYGDEVHVEPIDGDSLFLEWLGEGEGGLIRKFVITGDVDATAVYSEETIDKKKDHTLRIAKIGGDGEIEYRYYPSIDLPETFTLRLYSPALVAGDILLSIDNTVYSISVEYGESMTSIATKIDALTVPGWTSERDGWVVEFTAEDAGSKDFPATYDHNGTEAEARLTIEVGTIADVWTSWRTESYIFNKRFSTDDIVEVNPLDGEDTFLEWIGEGVGSPLRSFTMLEDADATAIYSDADTTHGKDYTLLITRHGGDHYEIPGSLEWRLKAAQNQNEQLRIQVNSGALESGTINLRLDGRSRDIFINEGDSAIGIAAKFEGLSFTGYTTERSEWTVTFTATQAGAKGGYSLSVPWLSTADPEDGFVGIVDIRDTLQRGATADQWTVWNKASYPFRNGFNTEDRVEISPLPGKYAYFERWTGEGTGSPVRTFIMDQSLDATAIYEGERDGTDDERVQMHPLALDRYPDLSASLEYRSKSLFSRPEESTLTITRSAKVDGTVAVRLGGWTYSVSVNAYDSKVAIATALASIDYIGWEIEHSGWVIKFTATEDGAKEEPAYFVPSNSLAEGRFTTQRGSIEDEWTVWTSAQFNLMERFHEGDSVEARVTETNTYTQFDKWTGEGTGSPTRSFFMSGPLDATAHFTSTASIAVKTWDEIPIDATSVKLNAEVIQLEKYESVQRGFVWAFTDSPTIDTDDEGIMLNAEGIITAGSGGLGFFDGIIERDSGANEVAILTVASGASADGHVTITTEGNSYNVSVVEGDTAVQVAHKINAYTFPGWSTTVEGYQVIFTADIMGPLESNIWIQTWFTGVEAGFAITKGSEPPEDDATYYYRPYITVNDRQLGTDVTEYGEQGSVQFTHNDFAVKIETRAKESGIEILPYTGIQYHADQTVLQLEAVTAAEVDLPFLHWLFYTGRAERSILTVTGGATSTGTCSISLVDNTDTLVTTTINLVEGDPPTTVAQKIADADHPDWEIRRNDNQVLYEATAYAAKSTVASWDAGNTGVIASMENNAGEDGVEIGTEVANPHNYTVTQDVNIRAVFDGELGTITVDVTGAYSAYIQGYYRNTNGVWTFILQRKLPTTITPINATEWLLTVLSRPRLDDEDRTETTNVSWSGAGEEGPDFGSYVGFDGGRMPTRRITMTGSNVTTTLNVRSPDHPLYGFISDADPDPNKGEENHLWFKYEEE